MDESRANIEQIQPKRLDVVWDWPLGMKSHFEILEAGFPAQFSIAAWKHIEVHPLRLNAGGAGPGALRCG